MSAEIIDVLTRVRKRLEKPEAWGQGAEAAIKRDGRLLVITSIADPEANCWCWSGALHAELLGSAYLQGSCRRAILDTVFGEGHGDLVEFNDDPLRSHADILAALDKTIARLSEASP